MDKLKNALARISNFGSGVYRYIPLILLVLLLVLGCTLVLRFKHRGYKLTFSRDKAKGIVFGKLMGLLYAYSPESSENHIICFGASGKGKTSAVLIPSVRSLQQGCFIIDIAGDICANVDKPDKLVYDPTDPKTIPYNIFGPIDALPTQSEKNMALRQLAMQIICREENDHSDPYFVESAQNLLTAMLISFYPSGADFIDICKIFVFNDYEDLEHMMYKQEVAAAIPYYKEVGGGKNTTVSYIKQEVVNKINLFLEEPICNSIRRPKEGEECFTPDKLESNSVFFCVPEGQLDVYAPLVRVVCDQVFTYLHGRPKNCERRVFACLDEFTEFGGINVERAMRLLRKKRVRLMLLTQSVADLDRVYGANRRRSIMNNAPIKVLLGVSDVDEQQYFSQLFGKHTVKHSDGHDGHREVEEPWFEPRDLDDLGENLIVAYPGGHTKLRKHYYWRKKKWKLPGRKEEKGR